MKELEPREYSLRAHELKELELREHELGDTYSAISCLVGVPRRYETQGGHRDAETEFRAEAL